MGMYRLGDIIRMTRKSLSITQEQLSDGICSVKPYQELKPEDKTRVKTPMSY
jgi:hypothetical protein